MIVSTKTGLLLEGDLGRDAEVREFSGGKRKLTFSLRYGWEEPAAPGGKRTGKYLDVDVWNDIDALDGMLHKGDTVIVTASEVKSREYNGKTYRSVSATGLYPSAEAVLGWMQQVIDLSHADAEDLRDELALQGADLAYLRGLVVKWEPVVTKMEGWQEAAGDVLPFDASSAAPAQAQVRQTTLQPPAAAQRPAGAAQMQHGKPVPSSLTANNIGQSGDLAGHELYPGEQLSDYALPTHGHKKPAAVPAEPPIDEAEDLPF